MKSIAADILNGEYDKEFDSIIKAIRSRTKTLRSIEVVTNLMRLKVGDRVITHNLSPKYLSGMRGEVVERSSLDGNSSRIPIKVDENSRPYGIELARGRRFNLNHLLVPANCLTKIEE